MWLTPKQYVQHYLQYANTAEAYAVLFVRKYLRHANGKVWVDILSWEAPAAYGIDQLRFRHVECELFPKRYKVDYPGKWEFDDDEEHRIACRAATWETSRLDIAAQRRKGVKGRKYRIDGACYPVRHEVKPLPKNQPELFFRPDAPAEIKALAKDLSDRTDPLWDRAMEWANPKYVDTAPEEYEFRVTGIHRL